MTKWKSTATFRGKTYEYSPRMIPYHSINAFMMDGKSRLYLYYKNLIREHREPLEISDDTIRKGINANKEGLVGYNPMADEFLYALLANDYDIKNNVVAIIGCTTAWYACMALAHGAKSVVVITEREVKCDDKRIAFASPEQVKKNIADYAFSVCEVQDAGLGKYTGDMNPDGDIEMMKWAKDALKPSGKLFLSIPCGADMVVWNRGRIYGRHRIKKLMDGWTLKSHVGWDNKRARAWTVEDKYTPLFVLEKQ